MSTTEPLDVEESTRTPIPRTFQQLLVNTLMTSVTSSFLWFALTFWVYLETRSVVATGVIGGAFSITAAALGPVFGTFVDRHRKKTALTWTTALAALSFAAATTIYASVSNDDRLTMSSPWFWLLIAVTLVGSVSAQMRGIALSTCVTLLVPEDARDRANGMVGTVTGISFAITSVFSGSPSARRTSRKWSPPEGDPRKAGRRSVSDRMAHSRIGRVTTAGGWDSPAVGE